MLWTGTEMLAFGMMDAAFSPATNRWRPLAPGPGGPSVTAWTGRQVLMWGGGCCGASTATGFAYDVSRNEWNPMPAAPLAGRHTDGVWTGRELIIVGGRADEVTFADGAAYDPDAQSWRLLPSLPTPVFDATVTWTGTEVLVVGGARTTATQLAISAQAMAYNPNTNTWRRLADMPMSRCRHVAVWTGTQLLIWGGQTTPLGDPRANATPPYGLAYDPATNQWSPMPKSPLRGRTGAIAVWTGSDMLIWGGTGVDPSTQMLDGAAFRPATTKPG